jgi:hypothetical protein
VYRDDAPLSLLLLRVRTRQKGGGKDACGAIDDRGIP